MTQKFYKLPDLPYSANDLEPYISEAQLKLHHDKHHLAYVNGANAILEKLDKARREGAEIDQKSTLKELSFHIGGHLLHSLFWANLRKPSEGGPVGSLADEINSEFGSFERFRKEFTAAAVSVEGSGWAALAYCMQTRRPIIMQIEKHNVNVYPMFRLLLVLDVWEHAYYLDYKNDRAKFVAAFWHIADWEEANRRFESLIGK